MSAVWLSWAALLPLVALNVRRWWLLRSLSRERASLKAEAAEAYSAGFRHQYNRRASDVAEIDKRIHRAVMAPIWRWTP